MNPSALIQAGTQILTRAGIFSASFEAKRILSHCIGTDVALITGRQRPLETYEKEKFFHVIRQRSLRIPLQHILGQAPFYGYIMQAQRGVFIPRFETEVLVEKVLAYIYQYPQKKSFRILDMCCGSGNIAVSLAKEFPCCEVMAIDQSAAAIALTQDNVAFHKVSDRVQCLQGDLFTPLREVDTKYVSYFDIIVSNPPYIKTKDMHTLPEEVQYDPFHALDGGIDGLMYYRKILQEYRTFLTSDGALFFEIGHDQADDLKGLMQVYALERNVSVYQDLNGQDRVVEATLSILKRSSNG